MKTLHTLTLALLLTCSGCVGHPAQDDFWRPWYDDPSQGAVFTSDKVTFKIRHIWGSCVVDYRGFQRMTN